MVVAAFLVVGGPAAGRQFLQPVSGQQLGRLWPRDEVERAAAIEAGYELERVLDRDDLVAGEDVFFSATGITDGDVLQGVRYPSAGGATTESLVTRARTGTIRRITATHDRAKLRAVGGERYSTEGSPTST